MKTFKEVLIELNACSAARKWAGDKTIEQIVEQCHRGDWLLWLAKKIDIGLQPLTLAKGHCANTVKHLMKDERSINAIDISIAYGKGKATLEELDYAATAAYAAADVYATAAYAAADAYAAYAAAAYAAEVAASAAADASRARQDNRMLTADICRIYVGQLIINKVNEIVKNKQPKTKTQ